MEASLTPGLRFNWVRILSVFGPYDREASMIMSSLRKLIQGDVPLFTKGDQVWDFLYASDAARALTSILFSAKDRETYVLGSGRARPLREYIATITGRFRVPIDKCLGKVELSSSTPFHLAADITPLVSQFAWNPEVTFEDGLEKTIQYCLKNPRIDKLET
jgi:nucleoside-diphosphate-sugar epimerase